MVDWATLVWPLLDTEPSGGAVVRRKDQASFYHADADSISPAAQTHEQEKQPEPLAERDPTPQAQDSPNAEPGPGRNAGSKAQESFADSQPSAHSDGNTHSISRAIANSFSQSPAKGCDRRA